MIRIVRQGRSQVGEDRGGHEGLWDQRRYQGATGSSGSQRKGRGDTVWHRREQKRELTKDQTQRDSYQPSRGARGTLGKEIITVNRSPEVPGHGSGVASQIPGGTPMPSPRRQVRPGGGHQCSPP